MANKKYYYRNKTKASRQAAKESARDAAASKYSMQQLSVPIGELGLSEATLALLQKNSVQTAGDIVLMTEKDMYRIQGLNKRMLTEIKTALRAKDMELMPDASAPASEAPQKKEKPKQDAGARQAEPSQPQRKGERRFGLADRREEPKPAKPRQLQERGAKPRVPEKLTAPLPVEQWRKIMKGGKWGFSDGFKVVIPAMYDEVFCFKEGLASVELEGKCGYIDPENNVVIPFEYEIAMSFSEGLAMVVKTDKCGYINKQNEVVIPFLYDAATPFEEGEAKVKKDGRWATVYPDGKLVWI